MLLGHLPVPNLLNTADNNSAINNNGLNIDLIKQTVL